MVIDGFSGWIPCSERLPEMHKAPKSLQEEGVEQVSDVCLITVQDRTGTYTEGEATLEDGEWGSPYLTALDFADRPYSVLAWRPYPEPWKG